jgi:hypothetical protein
MFGRRKAPEVLSPVARAAHSLAPAARRLPERILPPAPRPNRVRPPLLGLALAGAGWLAWNATLYRGQVLAEAEATTTAPADRVWAIFEDLDRWPLWQPDIPEAGWLGRRRWEPGSRFRWTLGRLRMVSIVDAIEPGTAASWHSATWGYRGRFEVRVTESRTGTAVEMRHAIGGWGLWLGAPWFQTKLNRTGQAWVAALIAAAERAEGMGDRVQGMG